MSMNWRRTWWICSSPRPATVIVISLKPGITYFGFRSVEYQKLP
jgi:hypothetical protein